MASTSFPKNSVITADFGKGAEYLTEDLNKLGFKDVTYLKNNQEFKFSNDIKIKLYVNKIDHDYQFLLKLIKLPYFTKQIIFFLQAQSIR